MPVFDVIVLLLVLGGIGTGAWKVGLSINKRLAKIRRQKQGQRNASFKTIDVEVCCLCDNSNGCIDPKVDLYIKNIWWHKKCFDELKEKEL